MAGKVLKTLPKQKRKSYLPKTADGKIAAGPGRPKGLPNKITAEAKTMIGLAFEGLGGLEKLIETANTSDSMRMTFYTQLYAKLIPVQIQGKIDATIEGDGKLLADAMVDALARTIASARRVRDTGGVGEGMVVVIDNDATEEPIPQLVVSRKT